MRLDIELITITKFEHFVILYGVLVKSSCFFFASFRLSAFIFTWLTIFLTPAYSINNHFSKKLQID